MKHIFKYIKGSAFFPKYAPNVVAWRKKMSGKDTNKKPIDFNEADKKEIKEGIKKMAKSLTYNMY